MLLRRAPPRVRARELPSISEIEIPLGAADVSSAPWLRCADGGRSGANRSEIPRAWRTTRGRRFQAVSRRGERRAPLLAGSLPTIRKGRWFRSTSRSWLGSAGSCARDVEGTSSRSRPSGWHRDAPGSCSWNHRARSLAVDGAIEQCLSSATARTTRTRPPCGSLALYDWLSVGTTSDSGDVGRRPVLQPRSWHFSRMDPRRRDGLAANQDVPHRRHRR